MPGPEIIETDGRHARVRREDGQIIDVDLESSPYAQSLPLAASAASSPLSYMQSAGGVDPSAFMSAAGLSVAPEPTPMQPAPSPELTPAAMGLSYVDSLGPANPSVTAGYLNPDFVGADGRAYSPHAPRRHASGGPRTAPAGAAAPDIATALANVPAAAFRELYPQDYAPQSIDSRRRENLDAQRRFAQGRAFDEGAAAAARMDIIDEAARRQSALEADRRAAMAQARSKVDAAAQRASEMRVDPDHWYHDGGAPRQIGAGIAMALGAFAQGMGAGPNAAMQIIEGAISRDMDAQRANMANAREDVDAQRGLLALMQGEFEDRGAAEAAARALMLEHAAERARMVASGREAEGAQLQQNELVLQLDAAAQQQRARAAQLEFERQMGNRRLAAQTVSAEADAMRAQRRAVGGPARPRPVTDAQANMYNRALESGEAPQRAAEIAGIDQALIPRNGRFAEATSGEQPGIVSALSAQLSELERLLPQAGEDIPGIGPIDNRVPDMMVGERGRAIRQQVDTVTEMVGRLHSGGAISDAEFDLFRRILGADTEEGLRRGIARIRTELSARQTRSTEGRTIDQRYEEQNAAIGARPRGR